MFGVGRTYIRGMNTTNHRAAKDFSRTTVSALNKLGVYIVGSTWVPGADGSFANGERAYVLNDNGTQRLRSYADVRAMNVTAR